MLKMYQVCRIIIWLQISNVLSRIHFICSDSIRDEQHYCEGNCENSRISQYSAIFPVGPDNFSKGREKSTRCNIEKSEVKFLIMSTSWLEISNLKTSSAATVAFVWRLNITDAGIHRENLYCTGLQFFFTFAAPALSISVLVPASHRNRRNHVNLR